MRTQTIPLPGDSPGTARTITAHRWGDPGARPKVYLQAALHADEMPGVLALIHLMDLLDAAEPEGRILGEVVVVPLANPIGLSQWIAHKPQGRQELTSLQNTNRGFPDLAALAGVGLESVLTSDEGQNLALIRAALGRALAGAEARTELAAQRLALLRLSHDADHVLDLHCDHLAVVHLYASPLRPADTSLLCRCIGAELALISEVSGGHAFDEAHTAPWAALRRRFGAHYPIPAGCFASTVELRGQADVDDATAAADAANLMTWLCAVGAVDGTASPRYPDPPHLPLSGAPEVFAPQGGVVTWAVSPGAAVVQGQTIAHVTDPVTRLRLPVTAPVAGVMFRAELWPACLRGQGLAHVAGTVPVRQGDLLSD